MTPVPVDQRLGLAGDGGVGVGQDKGGSPHVAEFAQARQAAGFRCRPLPPRTMAARPAVPGTRTMHSGARSSSGAGQKPGPLADQQGLGLPDRQEQGVRPRRWAATQAGSDRCCAGPVEGIAGEGKHGGFVGFRRRTRKCPEPGTISAPGSPCGRTPLANPVRSGTIATAKRKMAALARSGRASAGPNPARGPANSLYPQVGRGAKAVAGRSEPREAAVTNSFRVVPGSHLSTKLMSCLRAKDAPALL